jgi:hypothetical protein
MPVGTVAGPATGGRSGVAQVGFGGAAKPRGVFPAVANAGQSEPKGAKLRLFSRQFAASLSFPAKIASSGSKIAQKIKGMEQR